MTTFRAQVLAKINDDAEVAHLRLTARKAKEAADMARDEFSDAHRQLVDAMLVAAKLKDHVIAFDKRHGWGSETREFRMLVTGIDAGTSMLNVRGFKVLKDGSLGQPTTVYSSELDNARDLGPYEPKK